MSVTDGTAGVVPFLTTNYQYDFNTGLITQTTDPNNLTSYFGYDSAWRVLTVTAPSGAVATTTPDRDANGNDQLAYCQQNSYTENASNKVITNKSWFNGAGGVLRSGSGAGSQPSSFDAVATVYDSMGRVLKQSNPYSGDSSGNGSPSYFTSNTYDKLSRVTQVTLPDSQTVATSYSGSTVTVTDQVGRQRQSTTDGMGRVTSVVEQNPTTGVLDSVNYQTTYSYDVLDDLTQVNQGGQLRTFVYDALSRSTSQTTPEAGTVTFTYNDSSKVLKRTDARGVESHYKYDSLNRPIQVWYTGVGGDDAGTIRPALPAGVAATADVTVSYNNFSSPQVGNGQVSSLTDGGGNGAYAYDSLSRLSSKTRVIDSRSYQTQYLYNTANQLTTLIYPSGKRVRTNHDSRGRTSGLDKVDSSGNVLANYMTSVGYNTAGQVTSVALANGVNETYGYNADRLQLTSQTATKGSTLMSLTYGYAASGGASGVGTTVGNSGQIVSISGTINSQSRSQAFTYDNVGRLLTATGWSTWNRRFAYDRYGNRTGMWDALTGGNQLQNIAIATTGGVANNRISNINGVTYSYDASGNCIWDGAHTYAYDGGGRQANVDSGSTSTSVYDASNWRVKKVAGGLTTHYVWEGARVIAEYNGSTGALISENVHAGSRMIARDQSGVLRYYHQDRLSTRLITDSNGSVVGTEDHFPFGEDTGTGSGENEKHRFTNYERDSESGTDQAINRQHHNASGKFMQPDIAGGSTVDPQSLNRYVYSLDDPVNITDPYGLFPDVPAQFNAAYGGPGIYWDGIRLMITEYEMVYRFWSSGAVDVQTGFDQIPEWMRKEYGIQNPNDYWRALPIGFQLLNEKHPCGAMADRAQRLADQAISEAGGANTNAVKLFDHAFSQAYLGNNGIGETPGSAVDFFLKPIKPKVPSSELGEEDFKAEFQDHEGDQTHHFAAFLSVGINDQRLAGMLHMWGTDFNNKADRALGWRAVGLGENLSETPGFLRIIGQYIRKFVCD